jgi:hypothetical protein
MEGTTLKARLALRQRHAIQLLRMYPEFSRIAELRAPHRVCGCLLWHKVRYGYRCLYPDGV